MHNNLQIKPVGYIKRISPNEDDKDRSLVTKIIVNEELKKALDGIENFSHIYIIFWMHQIKDTNYLHHPSKKHETEAIGVFATRAPIHPNPIGLTLVELIKREGNILFVKGLDAFDDTPVLDIKPYPDWEHGNCIIVDEYRIPKWLKKK
ncbi:MAG: tRNA (N6-threonylcarbamoyladenosine(37)-N6)-methyltransferase TrmO [Candidatus Lokiarchaeota archaeon]|nr:tRNA (N6-threonylcarbamoyladenosine(37)-N6)-methyltransferase TrmO [Candidatus Lokiarchaeota archaeon]